MANAQIQVKFARNKHGGRSLAYNGYMYTVKNNRGERTYWECVVKTCRTTLTTPNDIPVGFGQRQHTHPSDHASIITREIMDTIHTRSKSEIMPIPTIYYEEVTKLRSEEWNDTSESIVRPTFYSSHATLYRARRTQTPKLPMTTRDTDMTGKWTKTTAGEHFLLFDDGDDSRIISFATTDNLFDLANADTLYCDGTFFICPKLFYQIYTIHGLIDGQMYPLVYTLLPGKNQQLYTRFLTLLKTTMTDLHLPLRPTTVFLDFEIATHNALRHVFPGVTIKGCFFHFTQCIWRKAQQTGLQQLYQENDTINRLIRMAAVLPLIPLECVEDVWFSALEELEDVELPVNTTPCTDYVVTQRIEGDRRVWNHYDTEGPRTTNHLEAWHGKVKKVHHPHPNIYAIIRVFQEIQTSNEVNRIQRQAGGAIRPRAKRYRNINSRLTQLKERLDTQTMHLMEYADAASYLLHLG